MTYDDFMNKMRNMTFKREQEVYCIASIDKKGNHIGRIKSVSLDTNADVVIKIDIDKESVTGWKSSLQENQRSAFMKRYIVMREMDNVEVIIIRNKSDDTYSFINLTKQHICPCRFKTMEDAIADMEKLKNEGKINNFIEVKWRSNLLGGKYGRSDKYD